MQKAFDLASVRNTLRHGLEQGYWTVEQLDTPSNGFKVVQAVDRSHFPTGYIGVPHQNLLRSDEPQERVEAEPSPRDFMPAPPIVDEFDF